MRNPQPETIAKVCLSAKEWRRGPPVGMVSPVDCARKIGVSTQAVHEAIKNGRLATYDGEGKPLRPGDGPRFKFLKPEEAVLASRSSRKRIDATGDATLISYRVAREKLQGDLLQVRHRERGELVNRAEQGALFEHAAGLLAREIQTALPSWAEELTAVARTSVPATTQWLRGTCATGSLT